MGLTTVGILDGHADFRPVDVSLFEQHPREVIVHRGRRSVRPRHRVIGIVGRKCRVHRQCRVFSWLNATAVAIGDGPPEEHVNVDGGYDVNEGTVALVKRVGAPVVRHRDTVRSRRIHLPLVVVNVGVVSVVGPLVGKAGVLVSRDGVQLQRRPLTAQIVVLQHGLGHRRHLHLVGRFTAAVFHTHHQGRRRILRVGILVEQHVVVPGVRPVDRGHICRVGDEGFQIQFVVAAHPHQAVPAQFNGRRLVHFHLVTGGRLAFRFVEAQFIQPKFCRRPRRVVLIEDAEAVVPQSRDFFPFPQGRLNGTNRGARINHTRRQVVDGRAPVGVADAVGHAIEDVNAEVLVVLRVVADVSDLDRVPVGNGQIGVVVHVGKSARIEGDGRVGHRTVLVDDVDAQEGTVPPVQGAVQVQRQEAFCRRGVAPAERQRVERRLTAQRINRHVGNRGSRRRQDERSFSFTPPFVCNRHLVHPCGQPSTCAVRRKHISAPTVPVSYPRVVDKVLIHIWDDFHVG